MDCGFVDLDQQTQHAWLVKAEQLPRLAVQDYKHVLIERAAPAGMEVNTGGNTTNALTSFG
jgi:hypothetical protein